jgi:DNA segregation ATPase FtsK/SpoIIIE and related proteins
LAQKTSKNMETRKRASASKQISAEQLRQQAQRKSVILFALAVLFGCLVLIPGDSLWRWLHDMLLGLFGSWVILGPALMVYIAVITAMNKSWEAPTVRVWLSIFIIMFCCGTGYIFSGIKWNPGVEFLDFFKFLYTENTGFGGGVTGGLVALPILKAAGESGAKIIMVLMLFVCVMLLTGTTLVQLFKTVQRPVEVVSDGIRNVRQKSEERKMIMDNIDMDYDAGPANIDIPLDSGAPYFEMNDDPIAFLREAKEREPKERKKNNDKLEKLKEVFNINDNIKQVFQNKRGMTEEAQNREDDFQLPAFPESAPKPKIEEVKPVFEPLDIDPNFEMKQNGKNEAFSDTAMGIEIAKNAKEAADDFLKRQEENMKSELMRGTLPQGAEKMKDTYIFPPVSMLAAGKKVNPALESEELQINGRVLVETLKSFGVQTKILDICRGPSVTRYELQPAAGVKISKITNLADDLAMNLAATGVRIEAPIPGKAAVGIEVPNKTKNVVRMRELIESNSFMTAKSKLSVALGRDIAGQITIADLAKMPHMLIAGTTGSGKSVCINSLIVSLLYKASPEDVKLLMIDPKVVELGIYNGIPHLIVPVVTDPRKAAGALGWAVTEMLNRYKLFAANNVRDLEGYNTLAASMNYQDENGQPMPKMPQMVIIIDELSDLMMAAPNEVEDSICRLAQMARAAGMHLVVATQRPSVDVVTGLIKANIPSRIAFAVSSAVDSRTILDAGDAAKLLGQGDMLFAPVGSNKPTRIQGCFVSDGEIESIIEFVKKSKSIEYDETVQEEIEKNAVAEVTKSSADAEDSRDPMMSEAIKCVVEAGQASTSLLQRRLRLGYARAGRLVDEMEQMGIVGPHEGSKPRQVLMTYAQWLEMNMQKPDEE